MYKAYHVSFGHIDCVFPKSRQYKSLDDAKQAVESYIDMQRTKYGTTNFYDIVILNNKSNNYFNAISSIKRNGKWIDL